MRLGSAFSVAAGLALLGGCSLATSFAGLSGSADVGGAVGDGGPAAGPDGSTSNNGDAGSADGSMSSAGWGAVTIIQSRRSTGKPGVDLDQPTTKGTMLVVFCPDPKPPTPSGTAPKWQMMKASYGGTIVIWPDHPGGITHFTIMDGNNDLFFLEMSGVPADVHLSDEVDTGAKASGTTTESLTATSSPGPHSVAFVYIDTTTGSSASADTGWTSLGTDSNNDFAWFRLDPTAPFSATVTFSPQSPAAMMMVQVGNGN